jgi:hypothetical protein
MTSRERLERYLAALRRRLRSHILLQAAATAVAMALIVTCVGVWLFQREDFAPSIAIGTRVVLMTLVALVAVLWLWRPLRRLSRDEGAHVFEERLPEQRGRIRTYVDGKRRAAVGQASPLLELLAADAAAIAEKTPPHVVVTQRRLLTIAGLAAISAIALALLLAAGPSYWGFGSRHLLLGAQLPSEAITVKQVTVLPGDATVRRNSDVVIRATVDGFDPRQTQVVVRFDDQQQWEAAPMRLADEGQFDFKLYAVRGPLSYYVQADGVRSTEHKIGVVDLPRIERVRLTYSYPDWTGLDSSIDEESRDIRAVAGTDVKVEVFADAPLEAPALIMDGISQELRSEGNASVGNIVIERPGSYQIGARVASEFVALSDEYTIEIVPDEKPTIEIRKPGRDWRATSIEEVPVRILAEDDFKLRDVSILYSVNGGEWQRMPVGGGARRTENEALLSMEDLGARAAKEQRLLPGDLVSYYAVARDRKHTAQTDLFMVQVQPFERTFKQGQSGGAAGGGMADEQGAISERQREILLATWNLQRNDERNARSREQLEDSARMLAELQTTLSQQARTLARRTRARMDVDADERVKTFVESLERASGLMEPAAGHLSAFRLKEAVTPEQQALQQLLRAEAAFREVQVTMQQEGGGEGSQAARNFTEMFELEMDVEKSQYESESQLARQNTRQEMNEAIRKLKELAERQEKLAQQRNAQTLQEQRWQQEQLRREAEDLRRRLSELNRQQQSSSQQQQASNSQQQGQRGSSGSGGQRSSQDGSNADRQRSELEQALQSVNQALENMRAANQEGGGDSSKGSQSARRASENLRQALRQIDRPDPSRLDETLQQLAERTRGLVRDQQRIERQLYQALQDGQGNESFRFGGRSNLGQREIRDLVEAKQRMAAELSQLQSDMRGAVHQHRSSTPKTTQRLSEIVRDIEGSDVMYRLNRSAAEIYYGRAREAAPREGLITEALETLERDLRDAAAQAVAERTQQRDSATTDDLLAQVAELRRALRSARQANGADPSTQDQGARGRSERDQGDRSSQEDREGQPGDNRTAQANERGGRDSQGMQAEGGDSTPGASESGNSQRLSSRGGSAGAQIGLSAWNPITPPKGASTLEDGRGSLARQTAEISQRIREITNRMSGGELTQAELDALRRHANQLRRLNGDPMAEQGEAMLKVIDQIELTALNAAARARKGTPAHATLPSPESPRYREAVAEYYRRLGNR